MCLPRIRSSASSRVSEPRCERWRQRDLGEAARGARPSSSSARREALAVEPPPSTGRARSARTRRSRTGRRWRRRSRPPGSSTRCASANARGRSTRCDDEPHRRALEPAVLERQLLGASRASSAALAGACAGRPRASPARRRRPRPSRPRPAGPTEAAGAAADVEHAPARRGRPRGSSVLGDLHQLASYGPQPVVDRQRGSRSQASAIGSSGSVSDSIASRAASSCVLGDEHLLRRVVDLARVVLDRASRARARSRRCGRIAWISSASATRLGERDLHERAHETASGAGSGCSASRCCATPPLTRRGAPRSGNGTSITSKSFGTTVSGKIVRASRAASGPK